VIHSFRHFFRTFCTNTIGIERAIDVWMRHVGQATTGAPCYQLSDADSQTLMKQVPFDRKAAGTPLRKEQPVPREKATKAASPLLTALAIVTMICARTLMASEAPIVCSQLPTCDRDKNGTDRNARSEHFPQELREPSLTSDGSFDTEREGFEPSLRE
jgi:hypothetical protein